MNQGPPYFQLHVHLLCVFVFTTMTRGLSGQQHGVLHCGEAPCDAYDRCPRVVVREENGNMLLRSDQDRTGAECLPNTRMLQTLKKRPLLEVVILLILLSFSLFFLLLLIRSLAPVPWPSAP